ncbi:MAG: hypothetical protein GY801_30445 [bacterium]|nr:hypothetical protein [bacterium]
MDKPNKLGILSRVILALPILLCVTLSVYTVYEYERCLINPGACKSIVISQEESTENVESSVSEELQRGKEIREEYEKQQQEAGI